MNLKRLLILVITSFVLGSINSYAGADRNGINFFSNETDNNQNFSLFAFFDLRDRESHLQVTNTSSSAARIHLQIFNVGNICNENDFFDNFTGNDTHVYDMRDILTNDGNPSGVDLPNNAYGIVAISTVGPDNLFVPGFIIGNFRVLDNLGYEYRTNMTSFSNDEEPVGAPSSYYANFNMQGGTTFSELVGLPIALNDEPPLDEWDTTNVINTFIVADIDIVDNNEVLLSCRDVIFACVQPDDPIVDELFANTGENGNFEGINGASVASFEYGINNALPHSKEGELLCPGNVIDEGFLNLRIQGVAFPIPTKILFPAFIGLNNGNGRGSMDSLWQFNSAPFSRG